MSFSSNLETKILQYVFAETAYPQVVNHRLALFTAITDGEAGTVTEVSGGAYARQSVTFTVSGNTASNNAAVEYPTATADWGTITHVGVYDQTLGGNLMAYAELSSPKNIETSDVFRVPSGDLDITLN